MARRNSRRNEELEARYHALFASPTPQIPRTEPTAELEHACNDGWVQYTPPGASNKPVWYPCVRCNRHGTRNTQPPDGGPRLEAYVPPASPEPPKPRPAPPPPESMKARNAAPDSFTTSAPVAPGSATSRAAAESLTPEYLQSSCGRVEMFIKERGKRGATREEIAEGTGLPLQTVNPRCVTLYKQGWIGSNPGDTRPTNAGKAAEVLLHEAWVERWTSTQRRPATRERMK